MTPAEIRAEIMTLQCSNVAAPDEMAVYEPPSSIQRSSWRLAVDQGGRGRPCVLIAVADSQADFADRRSVGVHVVVRTLEGGEAGDPSRWVDVSLQQADQLDVFCYFAADLLSQDDLAAEPLTACRRTVMRWRSFLESPAKAPMSARAIRGLVGELYALREAVRGGAAPASAWRGFTGHAHDFFHGHVALEVKTTLSLGTWQFHVNGVAQLQAPDGVALYLAAIELIEDQAAELSLPRLVEDLVAAGLDRIDLFGALLQAGCDARLLDDFAAHRYRVNALRVFSVAEGFPRIVESDFHSGVLPPGVSRLQYDIDLSGLIPDSDLSRVFAAMRA